MRRVTSRALRFLREISIRRITNSVLNNERARARANVTRAVDNSPVRVPFSFRRSFYTSYALNDRSADTLRASKT